MFCNRCGSEIVDGASFCSRCGQPVGSAPAGSEDAPSAHPFTVTFSRESQWFAVNPAVKIIVDEKDEYRIDNGQTLRIPMMPGTHSLVFRCGVRNKVIDLTVERDLQLHLKWNRLTGSLVIR